MGSAGRGCWFGAANAFRPAILGAVDTELARCEYCARTQARHPSGGCLSCGAPLPPVRPGRRRLDVTMMGDREPRYIDA